MTTGRATLLYFMLVQLSSAGASWLGSGIPSAESIANFRPPASTRILDCRGRVIFDFFQEKRRPVPLESIPLCLRDAVVAVEDRRFYLHWGIDLVRIPGLVLSTLRRAGDIKGTSTITQQLARSMFLTPERSLARKLKEMALAVELERRYSKTEILELYFNQIWFGGSAYGVEAAAEKYFGRTAARLTPAECATLGAMLANPSAYSPYNHPDRLARRRNFFLAKMLRLGRVTQAQHDAAVGQPLVVLPPGTGGNLAPYFVEEVRRYLADRYGLDFVYRSGATVYTTLDLDMQTAANLVVRDQMLAQEKDHNLRPTWAWYDSAARRDTTIGPPRYLQVALVAMDVKTGYVRALVGGRDFRHSEYDRATQARRQAGSSFKPFLYTAAIDGGAFTAASIEQDSPVTIRIQGQPDYTPRDVEGKFSGPVTLRNALAHSINLVAVRLILKTGPEAVVRYAGMMGIASKLIPVYSLALGSVEVTPLEMTSAFNTLANSGIRVKPTMVTRVEDSRGTVLEENLPEEQPVLRPASAYVVTNMMQSVLDGGTGYAVRALGYDGPAAGKTGTTDDYTDCWFIGFTPELTCGVWVGFDKKKTIFDRAFGGGICAPIWAEFMKQVKPDSVPADSFAVPDSILTLQVCEVTGELATAICSRVRPEVFILNTEPRTDCHIRTPH
jgi:penicillin-binding protein 1A